MATEPPYSRTREAAGLLFLAGILGRRDGELVDGTRAQLEQAFDNLEDLLSQHGLGNDQVVRLVCYLTDMADMDALNDVFVERYDEPRPVRSTVAVSGIPGGATVEIEATAELNPR